MSLLGGTTITQTLEGRDTAIAELGFAFVAITPTPGTGIISFATSTTLAIGELNPDIVLYNPGPLNVFPLYLRCHVTVVSTASATTKFTQFIDTGNRITTTATSLTLGNTNPLATNQSQCLISVGANVLSAATAKRRFVGHTFLRPSIDIVHDIYQWNWGSPGPTISAPYVATVTEFVKNMMPICIPPGFLFGMTHWDASQSAGPTMEYELGYIEK